MACLALSYYPICTCPSLQVSAGSPYPAIARLTVAAPPSGGPGFLSIERPDSRPPRVGDTLNLNLRAVGSGATFSHYYYMVCMSWGVEDWGAGKSPLCGTGGFKAGAVP